MQLVRQGIYRPQIYDRVLQPPLRKSDLQRQEAQNGQQDFVEITFVIFYIIVEPTPVFRVSSFLYTIQTFAIII